MGTGIKLNIMGKSLFRRIFRCFRSKSKSRIKRKRMIDFAE